MTWTDERVELLKKLWADGLVGESNRGRARRRHAQRGHRKSAPAWSVGTRQVVIVGRAAAAQAALAHDARVAADVARLQRARAGLRHGPGAGTRADREHHPDRPAPHVARAQRKYLPLADRRSCHAPTFSSAAASPWTACLIATTTRASPTSRRPIAARTGGRSGPKVRPPPRKRTRAFISRLSLAGCAVLRARHDAQQPVRVCPGSQAKA